MGDTPQRRIDDPRINALVEDVAAIKVDLARNNETTEQVRDILTSFRVLVKVGKGCTVIAGAVAAIGAAAYSVKSGWHNIFGK